MPRGGARVRAGRKPKGEHPSGAAVVPFGRGRGGVGRGSAPPAPLVLGVLPDGDLREPPGYLTPPQAHFWRHLAPLAVELGTLTPHTAMGFGELCEQLALKRELAAQPAAPATTRLVLQLSQRIDVSLGRFRLTGDGRAAAAPTAADAAPANPWARVRGS